MGWKQWALIKIANKSHDETLKINFPHKEEMWGWTFKDTQDTKTRNPLSIGDIEKQAIGPNSSFSYGQTGKQSEWAGMSATIELYAKNATGGLGDRICVIFYSCPWGASGNVFRISDVASQWNVNQWGADYNGGALGSITVEVRKL